MSETIVLLDPFGPIPKTMNSESILGVLCPAFEAVSVVLGFGVTNCVEANELYMLRFMFCMVYIELVSQESPGKYICI